MAVIETTIQCTRKTVSSALVTMTCLSTPLVSENKIQDLEFASHSLDSSPLFLKDSSLSADQSHAESTPTHLSQQAREETQEAIAALEEQLKLYKSRALYAQREADRLLTLDWTSYRRYIHEARRYDTLIQETEKKIEELKASIR